jgi:septal ring factor EnvC (AmiA/AmiB activator)
MKVPLYALALVAIAGAAYFSNDNKAKLEEQQQARTSLIDKNKIVSATADKTQKELSTETDNLKTARSEKAEVEQNIDKLKSDETALQRALADVEGTLEEQAQDLADAKKAVEELEALNIDGGIEGIAGSIQDLEDQKKILIQDIGEIETTIEAAQKAVDKNREEIARLGKRKAEREARFRRNAMESVITAVDQEWGFVVIGAGKNTGFTPQTRLIVKRSGRAIAEVKPSSIEATQTIGEIDWDTLAPGARIQVGDRVILAKAATN